MYLALFYYAAILFHRSNKIFYRICRRTIVGSISYDKELRKIAYYYKI